MRLETLLLFAVHFYASPPIAAWIAKRIVLRRFDRGTGAVSPDEYARLKRWFVVPWLLYLLNVLAFAYFFAADLLESVTGAVATLTLGLLLFALAMVPMLLIPLTLYDVERRFRDMEWTSRDFLRHAARGWIVHVALVGLELALLVVGLRVFDSEVIAGLLFLTGLVVYFSIYPALFVWIWRARRLPDGPLRVRIDALLSAQGLSVAEILIIPAAGARLANAFFTGLFPWGRRIFLTDYLIDAFTPKEIESVVAHELGHLRHHHTAWNLGLLVLLTAVAVGVGFYLSRALHPEGWSAGPRYLFFAGCGLLYAAIVLVSTRALSRRFEYQADAFALEATRDADALASALRKLMRLNRLPVRWTRAGGRLKSHPGFESRIRAIERARSR